MTDHFNGLPPDPAPDAPPAAAPRPIVDRSTPYKLEFPIAVDGVEYHEVRVVPVTTGDRAKFDRPAGPRALKNVVRLIRTADGAPLPLDALSAFDSRDGWAIIDMVEPMVAPHFPAPPKAPTFAGDAHRKMIFLEAPLDFDGKLYDRIEVRRLTARDFAVHQATPAEERGLMPAFYDEEGKPVPDSVINALSVDDTEAVAGAMDAFMPRAWKADRAPQETSASENGETSPQP